MTKRNQVGRYIRLCGTVGLEVVGVEDPAAPVRALRARVRGRRLQGISSFSNQNPPTLNNLKAVFPQLIQYILRRVIPEGRGCATHKQNLKRNMPISYIDAQQHLSNNKRYFISTI